MKTHEPPVGWPADAEWISQPDASTLADQLAANIAAWLTDAIEARGAATLAVSGGSTPIPVFQALSQIQIDWNRVQVTLADERWVPVDDSDSNERLVREHLLQGPAANARFVGLKTDHARASEGQHDCEKALEVIDWPLDVLVLGMGNDGHTASLIPGAPELQQGLAPSSSRRCLALHPVSVPQARISLTRPVLSRARRTVLHITGEQKKSVLEAALADIGREEEMPIRAFLRPGLRIYWNP